LRAPADNEALWRAIADGTIDTVGTDHAPHTLDEKAKPYPDSPSGVPGIETMLPLLLDAHNNGKISLEKIVELTHFNPQKIFGIPENDDWVIVNMNLEKIVENKKLKTKCGWSPFAGWKLKGWPIGVIIGTKFYSTNS
jgi:dihydroorotase